MSEHRKIVETVDTLKRPREYAKAIFGGATAGIAATVSALSDGAVSAQEVAVIAGATLAGFGAVFFASNADLKTPPAS